MSNNIRALRQEQGLSLREVADRMERKGVSAHYSTLQKLELGHRQLTQDWIERFAEVLNVSPAAIISSDRTPIEKIAIRGIPVIGMVAAGVWREAVQITDDYITVPAKSPVTFGLRVEGDSMDKIAPDGAVVTIDPDQTDLHDHGYYVIRNGDDETTFKQYRANPARLEPVSSNSDHRTIILGKGQFSVVGRVVGTYFSLA